MLMSVGNNVFLAPFSLFIIAISLITRNELDIFSNVFLYIKKKF